MKKVIINRDIRVTALEQPPGATGILLVKQNDEGGHVITLAAGNSFSTGQTSIVLNTFPRAVTRLYWERYDVGAFWRSETVDPGIKPTTRPTIAIDDYYDTLDVYHQLGYSAIEMSIDNGPWQDFTGPFNIGAVDRPAGYWRFKIKALEPTRLESKIAYSLPTSSIKEGFPYVLPLTLS